MATRREARFKLCRRFGCERIRSRKSLESRSKDQRQKKCLSMAHNY